MRNFFSFSLCVMTIILLCSSCNSQNSESAVFNELKRTPISRFIRNNDGIILEEVVKRYKYKLGDAKYRYKDTEMSEYLFLLIDLDMSHKDYADIIKADPNNVRSGIIIQFAKTKTRSPRIITLFHDSVAFYNEVGKHSIEVTLGDFGAAAALEKIYKNEPLDIRMLPRYAQ